jgi:hypothetical protein
MWGHLSEERLLDVLEGNAAASASHAESCGRCRERLEAARSGLMLAREAGEIPEPSAVYWESFRQKVDQRIDGGAGAWRFGLRPALATAAALVALFALVPVSKVDREPPQPRTLPPWTALPPVAEDASFALLQGLEAAEDEVAVEAVRHGMADVVAELSDVERKQFAEALQAVLQSQRQGKKS